MSPVPAPELPSKKVNGLVESSGWRAKNSIWEPTVARSALMNPSSAPTDPCRSPAFAGEVGVTGEVEALIGVNSSFTRVRRVLLVRCMSPSTRLEGDIAPMAVCRLNTGDVKGKDELRSGRRGRDAIAAMSGVLGIRARTMRVRTMETEVGVQAAAVCGYSKWVRSTVRVNIYARGDNAL